MAVEVLGDSAIQFTQGDRLMRALAPQIGKAFNYVPLVCRLTEQIEPLLAEEVFAPQPCEAVERIKKVGGCSSDRHNVKGVYLGGQLPQVPVKTMVGNGKGQASVAEAGIVVENSSRFYTCHAPRLRQFSRYLQPAC